MAELAFEIDVNLKPLHFLLCSAVSLQQCGKCCEGGVPSAVWGQAVSRRPVPTPVSLSMQGSGIPPSSHYGPLPYPDLPSPSFPTSCSRTTSFLCLSLWWNHLPLFLVWLVHSHPSGLSAVPPFLTTYLPNWVHCSWSLFFFKLSC